MRNFEQVYPFNEWNDAALNLPVGVAFQQERGIAVAEPQHE